MRNMNLYALLGYVIAIFFSSPCLFLRKKRTARIKNAEGCGTLLRWDG
ncbi:MAG TPA: hypothetical protein PKW18_00845 [Candidatus Sumerlaeota bacterium]|nr:hypothetical protein [Candidatus Sumerlaeota bacterium]HRR31823.1 hypothetical protein [Candidatus Sumerlaeia bacterium]HON49305.1 hypothetical protein [Candidatus Sumerlaeota bacterium]HOR64947.1 hypothetical protein [Candidatus Sumerlaeota bacterium]HPL73100.1 hypothetical protein [Candidatus Sumerlaeota bacterium]